MQKRKKHSKNSKTNGQNADSFKYDWQIRVFQQRHWPPFLPFCAIAERTEPGKRWLVNAEGKTPEEAVKNLQTRLKEIESRSK